MLLPKIQSYSNLKGRRVLVRCDFNVSIESDSDAVIDDLRIRKTLPLINFLREEGAKIILCSHIGRDPEDSLWPVYKNLRDRFALFFWESLEEAKDNVTKLRDGQIALMENLRANEGEVKNDSHFTQELASLADIYVNEAFAVSHRKHASVVGVPKYLKSFAGIRFQQEVENLWDTLEPTDPSLFILGGAKFSTKEPLIEKMLSVYKNIFVGGAIANDLLKAQGFEVGRSLVSKTDYQLKKVLDNRGLILPKDLIVDGPNKGKEKIKRPGEIVAGDYIVDIGPESTAELNELIKDSSFILWNGPLGYYEKGYDKQTKRVARAVANSEAHTVIGGGDTTSALVEMDLEEEFDFVSTAGGAMLKLLLNGTLPGIQALKGE